MAFRKGMERVGIVAGALWLCGVGYSTFADWKSAEAARAGSRPLVIKCDVLAPSERYARGERDPNLCLIPESTFRSRWPQYDDMTYDQLKESLKRSLGVAPGDTFVTEPSAPSFPKGLEPSFWYERAAWAFLPILLTMVAWRALLWIGAGFRAPRPQ
ncbi:MAG: hypothetical protein KJS97_01600 [Alphaproteobacteria bacterium]|nr:hypothetical protein [Alphaproteobacteria bacterium]